MDALTLLSAHCKLAVRPPLPQMIPDFIRDAYRSAFFGRPGPAFVDLPANLILGTFKGLETKKLRRIEDVPKSMAYGAQIEKVVRALRGAKNPLVVVGKGAAVSLSANRIHQVSSTDRHT